MNRINESKKRLFGAVWVKKVIMTMVVLYKGLFLADVACANNVRISGEPDVQLNATSDSLQLKFTLSWDNSWRDDFNWDAVWLFVKYRKEGSNDAWSHLYLSPDQSGTANLEIDPGNTGDKIVGAFVYPKNSGAFNISGEQVVLKASLNGLSASDITNQKIYFAVEAIEMVLLPYGPYYLGDGFSHHTFRSVPTRIIPADADIIGTDTSFSYSCIPMPYYWNAAPENAANRVNSNWDNQGNYVCHISESTLGADIASHNISWTVNFKSPKTIRTFGVASVNFTDATGNYIPSKDWYLLGSNDSLVWDTLKHCIPEMVIKAPVSYPVRHAIRVEYPGPYQYYRLFFLEMNNGNNGFMLANVAMSEQDLYPDAFYQLYVDSEEAIPYGKSLDGLYVDDGTTWTGTLPAAYPKGYKGFYMMKYELSQEQYVNFLNMLNYSQQKNRIGNNLDDLHRGDYVFGDPAHPSCRNGIAVFSHKGSAQPVVFGNNLNPADPFFAGDDGQTLACNYLTGPDMLAYLDWSGLRPLSELEYEKACRTPDRSLAGEYAWNTTGLTRLNGQSGLSASTIGTENEMPSDLSVNANAGNAGFGPVRCGSFGSSTSNQQQSGASFYGVMELSGNLGEMCYSVFGGSGLNVSSSNNEYHGDGVIASDGNHNVSGYWNGSSATGMLSIRGGSFASADSLLRVSDRSVLMDYDNGLRDSTVTFRGVRSIAKPVGPGEIAAVKDMVCPGERINIQNISEAEAASDVSYLWYVKCPGSNGFELLPGETEEGLTDYEVVNETSASVKYEFKRKALAFMGEAFSDPVDITVEVRPQDVPEVPLSYNSVVGDSFDLPCFTVNQEVYEWKAPNGDILNCGETTVTTRSSSDVYQVYFVNQYGCKGDAANVVVKGYAGLPVVPKHAREYIALGAIENGVYMLDPDGPGGNEPQPVYCDMVNDGGGWMLIVNSLANTSVSVLYTAGVYNAAFLSNLYRPYKYADSWINLIAFDTYWTEGRDACGEISHSYWKASECIGGGVYATLYDCGDDPGNYCCYKRYGDAAFTTTPHIGTYKRCMFDDDRANDAYLIWPYHCQNIYVKWGYACSNGGAESGEYRIWVR